MPRMKWTDALVEQRIRLLSTRCSPGVMPTASQMRRHGENRLACKVSKSGGFDAWADRLGLAYSEHHSRKGWRWEEWVAGLCEGFGYNVQRANRVKSSWDLMVNGHTVDVKYATGAVYKNRMQWTWRIETKYRCEFYVMVATENPHPPTVQVIPNEHVPKSCLTTALVDKSWVNRWDILR